MRKHITDYTRAEVKECLQAADLPVNSKKNIARLRVDLSVAVQNGDAPELEDLPDLYVKLARDEYGTAVRDNTREQLMEIGRDLVLGTEEDK